MRRLPDWRARLTAYLSVVSKREFLPGDHDCALFAAGAVEAMTGVDLAADLRGKYSSIPQGVLMLRKAGHRDHVSLTANLFEEVPPAFAQVGDLAIVAGEGGDAMGVVQGHLVFCAAPSGLGVVELMRARRAFRVPY